MYTINGKTSSTHIEPEELAGRIGETVLIHGMIYKIRRMSGFAFVLLRTKRHLVQCVHSEDFSAFALDTLGENMSVVITGHVAAEKRSRTGYEIRLLECERLSSGDVEMPLVINQKELLASLETLLDYRQITLRNVRERAVFKLQEGICRGFRDFLHREKFTEIHSPKLVFSGAEGGSQIFALDYFGKEAFLAQSPQFYKQIMVGVFERVYEIGPVFRAEKHDTARHVNEYTSVDIEMGFIDGFEDICRLEINMLAETFELLKSEYGEELSMLDVKVPKITDVPMIRFDDAKALIAKRRKITDPDDFDPEEEKLISEIIKNETGSDFVFVTHYKSSKRPFYAKDDPDDTSLTVSFDLLFRGVEITTGGQRIHDYDKQREKMLARGMEPSQFASYLMAHKHGLPPHGGFGLGLERFTARLLEKTNIRYTTLFPRDINRLEP